MGDGWSEVKRSCPRLDYFATPFLNRRSPGDGTPDTIRSPVPGFRDTFSLMEASESPNKHRWTFFRSGGLDQVQLQTVEDLRHLRELDLKLWVALASPARDLAFDQRTLDWIDADKDGRIRADEVLRAVDWTLARLQHPEILFQEKEGLPLASIREDGPDGPRLMASAKSILRSLRRKGEEMLRPGDTANTVAIFSNTRYNGDGVILPSPEEDPGVNQVVEEILRCHEGVPDRGGRIGVNGAMVATFYEELRAFEAWWAQGEKASDPGSGVLPLGAATPEALAVVDRVRAKVDDFFVRCELTAFDERSGPVLNRTLDLLKERAAEHFDREMEPLRELPLAPLDPEVRLPLHRGLNPAWTREIEALRRKVVEPLLGGEREQLTLSEWDEIKTKLKPYQQWNASKPPGKVEKLGIERIREILAGQTREAIEEQIRKDLAQAPEMAAIESVDRLVRMSLYLVPLLRNFIAFDHFYSPAHRAVFQHGTLYLDGRSTELCIRVQNPDQHHPLGSQGRVFLAYCALTRKDTADKAFIVAGFTNGSSRNLKVGRNGVYYDREGKDWDATIVRLAEHPMSLREAAWMPYRRLANFITSQIEKWAASRDQQLDQQLSQGVEQMGTDMAQGSAGQPRVPPSHGPNMANTVGVLAAVALAIGAIGTALATTMAALLGMVWWQIPLAITGVIVLISGPPVIMAWLELRQRTLAPILDACGWAVNGAVKITFPLGRALTRMAVLPPGARRRIEDPYANQSVRGWLLLLLIAVGLAAFWVFR